MKLSEKYGVPETTIKAMIKDGWISCTVSHWEEIVIFYKAEIQKGVENRQAIHNTSVKAGLSERQIYTIVHKFELK